MVHLRFYFSQCEPNFQLWSKITILSASLSQSAQIANRFRDISARGFYLSCDEGNAQLRTSIFSFGSDYNCGSDVLLCGREIALMQLHIGKSGERCGLLVRPSLLCKLVNCMAC